jgi:hypothetical protein
VNDAGVVENSFRSGGFARVNMSSNTNIPNSFQGNCANHIDLLMPPNHSTLVKGGCKSIPDPVGQI